MEEQTRKNRSQGERDELLERWAASGETVKKFCEREGINVSLFHRWRQKARGDSVEQAVEFVELTRGSTSGLVVSVECANGRRIVVQGLTLKEVLAAVEGA